METNHVPEAGVRKKRVVRRDPQQVEQRLNTLKELTAAILSYSKNQVGGVEQINFIGFIQSIYVRNHYISNVYENRNE